MTDVFKPGEFLHSEEQLWAVARGIFHGDEPGSLLAPVPQWQFAQVAEILDGMDARRSEHFDLIKDTVAERGLIIQQVFPTRPGHPHFAYTIGLHPEHGGEFLIRGFGGHCGNLVSTFADHVMAGTVQLVPGVYVFNEETPDSMARCRIDVWRGDPNDFGMAMAHHGSDFPRFHLVLADDFGRFPEDDGCECAEFQMLGLPA